MELTKNIFFVWIVCIFWISLLIGSWPLLLFVLIMPIHWNVLSSWALFSWFSMYSYEPQLIKHMSIWQTVLSIWNAKLTVDICDVWMYAYCIGDNYMHVLVLPKIDARFCVSVFVINWEFNVDKYKHKQCLCTLT